MSTSCVKCSRELEVSLEGAGSTQCLLCIGEGINLLAILKSLSRAGLKPIDSNAKCCICNRNILPQDISCKSDHGHVCEACFGFFQNRAGRALPIILSEEKTWLVKSSLKIEGPFEEKIVLGAIRNRDFASLDEACAPRKYWTYFRDIEKFQDAVRDIAISDHREDDTVDITKSMTGSNFGTDPGLRRDSSARVVDVKHRFMGDGIATKGKGLISRFLNIGLIGVLLVLATVGVVHLTQKKSSTSSFSESQSREALDRYWNKGQNREYLSEIKQLEINGYSLEDWDLVREAAILVSEDQGFLAQPILDRIDNKKYQKEIALLESKIAFLDRNTSVAIQKLQSLPASLKQDQMLKINLAFLKIHAGNLKEGEKLIPPSAKTENLNSNRSITEMYFWIKSGFEYEESQLDNLEASFSYYVDASTSFDLFRAIMYLKNGFKEKAFNAFSKALSTYPEVDSNFKQNLFMMPYIYRYEILNKYFSRLKIEENPALENSVRGLIAFKRGNIDKSLKYFTKADSLNPNSSLINVWKDFLINGELEKIPFKLDPLFFNLSSPLKIQLTGEKCLKEQNWDCAKKSFQKLLADNPRSYRAVFGMLQYHEFRGNKEEARDFFRRGIGLAPRFIPFLKKEDSYL